MNLNVEQECRMPNFPPCLLAACWQAGNDNELSETVPAFYSVFTLRLPYSRPAKNWTEKLTPMFLHACLFKLKSSVLHP